MLRNVLLTSDLWPAENLSQRFNQNFLLNGEICAQSSRKRKQEFLR